MEKIIFKIKGVSPIILNSDRCVNQLDQLTKDKKKVTSKRKKTDEDYAEISWLEWCGSLYFDEDIGPYIPGQNIEATINGAAKLTKRGKDTKRGLQALEAKNPLEYDGPRTREKLFRDGNSPFVDIRSVVVNRARIMKSRPIFNEWALKFTIAYNAEIIDRDDIVAFVEISGEQIGLCDYRPRYGRFEVIEWE